MVPGGVDVHRVVSFCQVCFLRSEVSGEVGIQSDMKHLKVCPGTMLQME